jgi:hypothetical protein
MTETVSVSSLPQTPSVIFQDILLFFFLYAYCFLHHSEYPGFWAFWVNGSPQKYGGTTWIIPIFFYVLILDLSTFATKWICAVGTEYIDSMIYISLEGHVLLFGDSWHGLLS